MGSIKSSVSNLGGGEQALTTQYNTAAKVGAVLEL